MKKLIYLLMSLSLVAFVSCSDDKENEQSGSGNVPENSSSVLSSSGKERGHSYVDLGLPSGTLWATCNVGAATPQDYGNYYAWGETTTKEVYNWETYRFTTDGGSTFTKYTGTDSKTALDLSDDAAYVNWGGKWRMPTKAQQDELKNECYWVWTESYNSSNVKGYIVYKAKSEGYKGVKICENETPSSSYTLSDAHIFLPAAGCRFDGVYYAGSSGHYWSSSLCTGYPNLAWEVRFHPDFVNDYCGFYRYYGQSVRAVIPGNK